MGPTLRGEVSVEIMAIGHTSPDYLQSRGAVGNETVE